MFMKEYLIKRIEEVRKEEDMWLDKYTENYENDYYRIEFLKASAVRSELCEILIKISNGEINE